MCCEVQDLDTDQDLDQHPANSKPSTHPAIVDSQPSSDDDTTPTQPPRRRRIATTAETQNKKRARDEAAIEKSSNRIYKWIANGRIAIANSRSSAGGTGNRKGVG